MRHALNTMFCLLSVSCLVGELFLLTHDRYANSMLYKIDSQVEGTTIPTQMFAARAPQAITQMIHQRSTALERSVEVFYWSA